MRNVLVLGVAMLMVAALTSSASAQCCGSSAPVSYGYSSCDQGCNTGCNTGVTTRVRLFNRRSNCCAPVARTRILRPAPSCCPAPVCCPTPVCESNCGNTCGSVCGNNCGGTRTFVLARRNCNSCNNMYTSTCGTCNSCGTSVNSGCPGCVGGQMIMDGGVPTEAGTVVEPGVENSVPAVVPPTPEDT